MMTVQKIYDDLDYWIMIGIGDDIVNIPEHRPEYQHLVARAKLISDDPQNIPILVLWMLGKELEKPVLLRPTTWRLAWISAKKAFFKLMGK